MIAILLAHLAHAQPDVVPPALDPGPAPEQPAPAAVDSGLPAPPEPAAPPAHTLVEYLPPAPRRGLGAALGLTLTAAIAALAASTLRRGRERLLPTGLLPDALAVLEVIARGTMGLAAVGAVLAVVPEALVPAAPWIAVAVALALGWSARDALPDLVAWAVVTLEGRIRVGGWVRGDGFAGRVESIRPRVTWLVDGRAQRVAVPNRRLLDRPVYTDPSPWPEVEVTLHLPPSEADLREVLRQAVLLSPWLAPGAAPEVAWDPVDPTRWTIRVRLVDGRFEGRFTGSLPERVHELLAAE